MTGFDADWLALREPFDRTARASAAQVLDWPAIARDLRSRGAPNKPLTVIDLACGTGANLREVAPRLGGRQRWLMVDHDRRLLDALPDALASWALQSALALRVEDDAIAIEGAGLAIEIRSRPLDLASQLDALPLADASLVTGSALLDLVSYEWLDALIARCSEHRVPMLWALNVDGRVDWAPSDPGDALAQSLFSAHQQRDKGFGPALGALAVPIFADRARAAGYRIVQAASDWRVDAQAQQDASQQRHRDMLGAMIDGIGAAALAQDSHQATALRTWQTRRKSCIADSRLMLGHTDLLAWPRDD